MSLKLKERGEARRLARQKGYWRSRWHSERDCHFQEGVQPAGVWLGLKRWPSAEIAEQKALDWMAMHRQAMEAWGLTFLGVMYFRGDDAPDA